MIYLNFTAECDHCKYEEAMKCPMQSQATNFLVVPQAPAPDGWGYKDGKLACPSCMSERPKLKIIKEES